MNLTKKMYGWSKYGGGTHGALIEDGDEWTCQSCGDVQSKELPSYLVPLDESDRDFMRVCADCKNILERGKYVTYTQLVQVTRVSISRNSLPSLPVVANPLEEYLYF